MVNVALAAAGELIALAAAVAGCWRLHAKWAEAGRVLGEILSEETGDDRPESGHGAADHD